MKLISVLLLSLTMSLGGCLDAQEPAPSCEGYSTNSIAGVWRVNSGKEQVTDNFGEETSTSYSEEKTALFGIAQNGAAVYTGGCIGFLNEEEVVVCDVTGFSYSPNLGPYSYTVEGWYDFDSEAETFTAAGVNVILYGGIGWEFTVEYEYGGYLDQEWTDEAQGVFE